MLFKRETYVARLSLKFLFYFFKLALDCDVTTLAIMVMVSFPRLKHSDPAICSVNKHTPIPNR